MPVTIVAGTVDVYYSFPGWVSDNFRDDQAIFYRHGVGWACLNQITTTDSRWGDGAETFSPAVFKSVDGGLTWTGPIDGSGAPYYGDDPDGTIGDLIANNGDGSVINFDLAIDSALNADDASHITCLIRVGTILTGPDSGEWLFVYADFDFATETWGTPYGTFNRNVNVVNNLGYSSIAGGSPVFWYSDGDAATPVVEGATTVDGLGGHGSGNLAVDAAGKAYVIAATSPTTTPPDSTFYQVSNLRFSGKYLYIASDAGGSLALWWRDLSTGGSWQEDPIPDADFEQNPWVMTGCCGQAIVTWLGSDFETVYRATKAAGINGAAAGTGWAIDTIGTDALGPSFPRAARNPITRGVDVVYQISPNTTFDYYGEVRLFQTSDPPCASCNNPPNGEVGALYAHFLIGCTGDATPTWSITAGSLPDGLTIDPDTGTISGTPTTEGDYTFTFQISGEGEDGPAEQECTITIGTAGLDVSCANMQIGSAGTPYTHTLEAGLGSEPATGVTWEISAGTLPAGLTLDGATGIISGTPTTEGTSSFSITGTNETGTESADCKILIIAGHSSAPGPGPGIGCGSMGTAEVGTPYSHTFPTTNADDAVFSSGGTLPPGTSLDSGTGELSGTPTSAGSFEFTIIATVDGGGPVEDGWAYVWLPTSGWTGAWPYDSQWPFVAQDDWIGARYDFGGGAEFDLPLVLELARGSTPEPHPWDTGPGVGPWYTASAALYQVWVVGGAGDNIAAIECSLAAGAGPGGGELAIDCSDPPEAVLGVPYSYTFEVTGGTPPYTFEITSGAPPPGLHLDASTGVISGTPTVLGTFEFTITATDADGTTVSCSTHITVVPNSLRIDCSHIPPAIVAGVRYSFVLPVSAGTPPYTFAITAGSLPPGLTLTPIGPTTTPVAQISGTPTTLGAYAFTISVTDGTGATASCSASTQVIAAGSHLLDLWVWRQLFSVTDTQQELLFPPGYEQALKLQLAADFGRQYPGRDLTRTKKQLAAAVASIDQENVGNSQAVEYLPGAEE